MKPRILVVDDQLNVAESIRDGLLHWFDVDLASNGLQALKMCRMTPYHGVILDIQLEEGGNGLEVLEQLRRVNSDVRVIVISAVDRQEDVRRRVLELGASFCEKPVTTERIIEIMRTH